MTQVSLRRFRPDGVNVPGAELTGTSIRFYPTRTVKASEGELVPIPKTASFANGDLLLNLLPTSVDAISGAWAWVFEDAGRDGTGSGLKGARTKIYKAVPASGTVLSFEELITLDPATLGPVEVLTSSQEQRLAALEAGGVGGGTGGGPITTALITDSTAVGRSLVKATDALAVRTAADAPSNADLAAVSTTVAAQGTAISQRALVGHTHTVGQVTGALAASQRSVAGGVAGLNGLGQVIDAGGVAVGAARGITSMLVNNSGYLIITYTDGTTSNAGLVASGAGVNLDATGHISDAIVPTTVARVTYVDQKFATVTDVSNTPLFVHTVNGAYPPRPATTRPCWFDDSAVQPTGNGSVSGGGGMVPGLDVWFR